MISNENTVTRAGDRVDFLDLEAEPRSVVVVHADNDLRDGFGGFLGRELDHSGQATGRQLWAWDTQITAINGVEYRP